MSVKENIVQKVLVCVINGDARERSNIVSGLSSFYSTHEFSDEGQPLTSLNSLPPSAIILDEHSPPWGGFRLVKEIKSRKSLANIPLILTSSQPLSLFFEQAECYKPHRCLITPISRDVLLNTISTCVGLQVQASWETLEPEQKTVLKQTVTMFHSISNMLKEGKPLLYGEIKNSCNSLVDAVSSNKFKGFLTAVREYDDYTYVNSLRVATFLSLFGYTIGIRGDTLLTLASGGLLHDVGKMSIPQDVLNKPGRLIGNEWEVMQSHVARTVDFLKKDPSIPKGVLILAAQRHEKLDGTGYPNGLKGDGLNELARMASIVDVFSALTDRRVYKAPMTPEKALDVMVGMEGSLDMRLLTKFRDMLINAELGAREI